MDKSIMEIRLKNWIPLFTAQAESGMNKKEWCDANNISRTAFYKWQRLYRAALLDGTADRLLPTVNSATVSSSPGEAFVELPLPDSHPVTQDIAVAPSAISISAGHFSINLSGSIDEANLEKVLRVMNHVI